MSDKVRIRDDEVDGVTGWVWPKDDTGAWDGPSREFIGLWESIRDASRGRPKEVIVQAGGCCGMYPRLWADRYERVYTFEPDPLNFYCLVRNCQDRDGIFKFQAALGENHQPVLLTRRGSTNVGEHTVTLAADSTTAGSTQLCVPQMRIDDLELEACDAIQLDVEGAEANVLLGASATIRTFRPVISVETCDMTVRNILEMYGYSESGRNVSDTIWAPS